MTLSEIALAVLTSLNGFLGVSDLPTYPDKIWNKPPGWVESNQSFKTSFATVGGQELCPTPSGFIVFPRVVHGAHRIFVDGRLVGTFGDLSFNTVDSFYGSPVVSCEILSNSSRVEWEVYSYSRYFARVQSYPYLTSDVPIENAISESLNVVGAGGLLLLAIFVAIIFWGKVPAERALGIGFSNLSLSFYFLGTVSGVFGLELSMLSAHKIADTGLLLGMALMLYELHKQGHLGKRPLAAYFFIVVVALAVIISGKDGDSIQFGTTLPFVPTLLLLAMACGSTMKRIVSHNERRANILQLLGLLTMLFVGVNDILVVTGLNTGHMLLPFGIIGALFAITLSMNERILETYRERDYLRANLEAEVDRKTSELKSAQAELVQSAKLASLGTLSAGLAHEINNAINYVNGALLPLERVIEKSVQDPTEKQKAGKLMAVMKDGLNLTVEIIRSLRNYSGLNQAKFNDIHVEEIVKSVTTILRNKLRDKIDLKTDIDPTLHVHGSVVGLNQALMNLVTNAIDAMPNGGRLSISAKKDAGDAVITVHDTGEGIPDQIKQRIFEPFFTTKDVGKGTGLGLHIVRQEVERHRGQLSVQSKVGEGTTFVVRLPIHQVGKMAA